MPGAQGRGVQGHRAAPDRGPLRRADRQARGISLHGVRGVSASPPRCPVGVGHGPAPRGNTPASADGQGPRARTRCVSIGQARPHQRGREVRAASRRFLPPRALDARSTGHSVTPQMPLSSLPSGRAVLLQTHRLRGVPRSRWRRTRPRWPAGVSPDSTNGPSESPTG
jgi:hypothetical protein